ncbi:DUF6115 domain-containing protein [Brevibacillus borstelensis]|jgi:hypothetical protein|uniref:DUF6115 domain-containing protein n=1 Tax=Brevibacillus borstelensis TaxID=45462 RepID=UPI000469CDD8|nr:hypothetical protein [Brevibacillus borstelensis]
MNGSYYILAGAGVAIMVLALLFSSRRSKRDRMPAAPQLNIEEVEATLQRFVLQIKQEKEAESEAFYKSNAQLKKELADAKGRLDKVERELTELRTARRQPASPDQQESSGEAADVLSMRERYRRVFELMQEGLGPDEIAKRLGAGRGEIDLILSLAKPREAGAANE